MANDLYNPEAEMLVLVAILNHPEDYWSINDVNLVASDFFMPENRKVMKAIVATVAEKKTPEIPHVMEEVRLAGGETDAYVARLASESCSIPKAHEYARTVKGLSVSRSLANVGAKIVDLARDKRTDYEAALAEADTLLSSVKRVLPPDERSPEASAILERIWNAGTTASVPVRFSPTLQRVTGGISAGHFWVVGGFSSVGKSAVACNLAFDALNARTKSVAIFSTEMTSEDYMVRMLSLASGVPQRSIKDRVILPFDDSGKLEKVKTKMATLPFRIDDTSNDLDKILMKARRMKETVGLDLMMVDFIQNITAGGDEFSDARTAALRLQQAAKDLDCGIVAFSQVSNEMAKHDAAGGDQNYYSFKGHGAIRDAADLGIMLRRDRIAQSPLLHMTIVKNRHGELADFYCNMELSTGAMVEAVAPEEGNE
jgi:replicative DNA helicase